jgi:hypothetical protein
MRPDGAMGHVNASAPAGKGKLVAGTINVCPRSFAAVDFRGAGCGAPFGFVADI